MVANPQKRPLVRLASNAVSVLTSDVLNRATTFFLYALVARHLDTHAFGQLSLALALFYTFQVFAMLGLPTPITRDVARNRRRTSAYLVNGGLLALLGSLASIGLLWGFVRAMNYADDTSQIILLLALGLVPYALCNVCEAVFRAWERMHLIAYANVPVNLAKIVVIYLLLHRGYGLSTLVAALMACGWIILFAEVILILWKIDRPRWAPNWRYVAHLARTSYTFLSIDGVLAIWASLNVVLLSKMTNEADVGLFNAANQLLVPFNLFTQSVLVSVFPLLCRKYGAVDSPDQLQRVSDRLIEVLLAVTVPGALALFCLADTALVLVYGNSEFAEGALVLQIMVATIGLRTLTTAWGHVLLAGRRERVTLRIVLVDLAAGLVLGVGLIHYYGVTGAAIAVLLVRLLDLAQHYASAARVLTRVTLTPLAWKTVVAGACMALVLWRLRTQGLVVTVSAGTAVYALALLGLVIYGQGGWKQPRARTSG